MPRRTLIALLLLLVCGSGAWLYTRGAAPDVAPLSTLRPIRARTPLAQPSGTPGKLIPLNEAGRPQRTIEAQGYRVELDLSQQAVAVEIPEVKSTRYRTDEFTAGDTVETTEDNVPLLVGGETFAKLPKGVKLPVVKVDPFNVVVSTRIDGEVKTGQVSAKQLKLISNEPAIQVLPTGRSSKFVSAAMLMQKAKQFDDGLYAAVELAAQDGLGKFGGKKKLLAALTKSLADAGPSQTAGVVVGAAMLGGAVQEVPEAVRKSANSEVHRFQNVEMLSKPLGFYTWNDQLAAIFKQDRLLQTELGVSDADAAIQALRADPESRAIYTSYLDMVERLTNPSDYEDLRRFIADGADPTPKGTMVRFVPPSRSYESTLVKQLFGKDPVPDGFDLMNELVSRIESRRLDVTPTARSGWYDHQTYALAALLEPPFPREPGRLSFGSRYRKHLTELFKGTLALTRETHVKQLESAMVGAAAPIVVKIHVSPEFTVEPLAEMYRRRADSYRFVRGVIEKAFGAPALSEMHRQTADGFVELDLATELQRMTELFDGAALVAAREAGLPRLSSPTASNTAGDAAGSTTESADTFLAWASTSAADDDLARDSRMMVPVFYDALRGRQKVWVFLGWQSQQVTFTFTKRPGTKIIEPAGRSHPRFGGAELVWHDTTETIATPVMAEVYVSKLLDRNEFRKHCDAFVTRSAILENLE